MAAMEAPVLYQGVAKESLAFRLMTQMGWEEGTGLGKNQQGIKSHVRVRQRKDNSGVGTDEQKKAAANWTVNTHIFDNILKNLKVKAAEPETKKESSDEYSSDDDSVEAVPVVRKVSRPQGRYKRREGGKLVKGYSATDLNAILGGEKPEAVNLPQAPKIVFQEEIKASLESKKETTNEEAVFVEMECEENIPQVQELAADWWGTKYGFVRGGALGSKQVQVRETVNGERPSENGRTQFSEQDQENLYNMVNDKATSGKKGLGQGERALKIGGVKVSTRPGQKKVFANMEESDGEDDAQEEAASNDDDQGVSENKSAKKRKMGETVSGNGAAVPLQEAPSKMKLKELVSQFLTEAPEQRMSLKRLQKRVTASTGLFSSKGDADAFRDKLLKSSKFVVEGKKVSLKSRT
jgi:Pin2-interacting protein X1